jgi:hypothetical protein
MQEHNLSHIFDLAVICTNSISSIQDHYRQRNLKKSHDTEQETAYSRYHIMGLFNLSLLEQMTTLPVSPTRRCRQQLNLVVVTTVADSTACNEKTNFPHPHLGLSSSSRPSSSPSLTHLLSPPQPTSSPTTTTPQPPQH